MNYTEDLVTAADYLKKAVPNMVKNQIPANPINYALWYHYVGNLTPALNNELDEIINSPQTMTEEQSAELFQHFILSQHLQDHQKTLEGFTTLTANLLKHIGKSMAGSESFGAELNANIEKIKASESAEDIIPLVENIISTSEDLRHANSDFHSQMEAATEEINELRENLKQAEKHAYIDQLTQVYNRHAFDRQLQKLLNIEEDSDKVCLVIFDLDHFKSFNDDYGHVIGDRVLKKMGEIIMENCPENAFGARYGGEEFAIIVRGSDESEAADIAENLRQKIQQLRVKMKNSEKVLDNISASFGVARFQPGESSESFIHRADTALYSAKRNGRNQVSIYHQDMAESA